MGSMAAARGKAEELKRWPEQMGEILCKQTFGEDGPDLKTSLADLEQILGPLLEPPPGEKVNPVMHPQGAPVRQRAAGGRPLPA